MALDRRKSGMILLAGAALVAVLGWAWSDGGERPVGPQSAPAMLPGGGQ